MEYSASVLKKWEISLHLDTERSIRYKKWKEGSEQYLQNASGCSPSIPNHLFVLPLSLTRYKFILHASQPCSGPWKSDAWELHQQGPFTVSFWVGLTSGVTGVREDQEFLPTSSSLAYQMSVSSPWLWLLPGKQASELQLSLAGELVTLYPLAPSGLGPINISH